MTSCIQRALQREANGAAIASVASVTLRRSTWNQRWMLWELGEECNGQVGARPSVRGWWRAGGGGGQVYSLE